MAKLTTALLACDVSGAELIKCTVGVGCAETWQEYRHHLITLISADSCRGVLFKQQTAVMYLFIADSVPNIVYLHDRNTVFRLKPVEGLCD